MDGVDFAFLFSSTANTAEANFSFHQLYINIKAVDVKEVKLKPQLLALKPESGSVQGEEHRHGTHTSLQHKNIRCTYGETSN